MSENNSLFIYTREDNADGNDLVKEHAIVPFFSLVPLSKKFHWQTNDTCQTDIFWQAYFSLATKHDIPINWDSTQNLALQSIRTYTQFKNTISKKDNKGEFVLKSDISSIRFIEYTPSFHRTIVNFIGQNDWDTFGLTDEPFDANLIMEFIKDTGYNVEQLVNEKKLYHNNNAHHDQIKNGTYVWFDCANDKWRITKNLNSFFTRKLYYIKKH